MIRMLNTVELATLPGWDRDDGSRPTLRDALSHLLAARDRSVTVNMNDGSERSLDFDSIREMVLP